MPSYQHIFCVYLCLRVRGCEFISGQVRVYDLRKAALVKKLQPNVKWLSSMDIHPSGDHVLCGSFDRVVNWYERFNMYI